MCSRRQNFTGFSSVRASHQQNPTTQSIPFMAASNHSSTMAERDREGKTSFLPAPALLLPSAPFSTVEHLAHSEATPPKPPSRQHNTHTCTHLEIVPTMRLWQIVRFPCTTPCAHHSPHPPQKEEQQKNSSRPSPSPPGDLHFLGLPASMVRRTAMRDMRSSESELAINRKSICCHPPNRPLGPCASVHVRPFPIPLAFIFMPPVIHTHTDIKKAIIQRELEKW